MSIYVKAVFADGFTYIYEKDNLCYEEYFTDLIQSHGNIEYLHLVFDE